MAAQTWHALIRTGGRDARNAGPSTQVKDKTRYIPSKITGNLEPDTPLWTVSVCFACKQTSLWIGKQLSFPVLKEPGEMFPNANHSPLDQMPVDAAELFSEAVAVLPHSKRASAALCRASLERLLKHLDPECPTKARLDDRIVRMETRVSTSTIEILNVLRHVGNTALHGEQDGDQSAVIYLEDTDGVIAETFFMAINLLVDELVIKPARSAELYNALPPGVRESYEAKAQRATSGG
ncbi:DUF4145 domain-containing protein [Arthrobacter sp. LAPM80]|uniref:DUF4145 domain-containing protein n=1 Tax=Arthrobacter sp. LAPM80 TaxID=3141788 RepID=UPI00398AB26F